MVFSMSKGESFSMNGISSSSSLMTNDDFFFHISIHLQIEKNVFLLLQVLFLIHWSYSMPMNWRRCKLKCGFKNAGSQFDGHI
jgi:hypothetical protein